MIRLKSTLAATLTAILALNLPPAMAPPARAEQPAAAPPTGLTSGEARGHFDVQITSRATTSEGIGRFVVTKKFHGDLAAESQGEMLAVRTKTPGSQGYVLIEHVAGSLKGRSGAFMLQHFGIMDRGRPDVVLVVVPDSGTGDLTGLAGRMSIDAADNHAYVLTYSLPAAH